MKILQREVYPSASTQAGVSEETGDIGSLLFSTRKLWKEVIKSNM